MLYHSFGWMIFFVYFVWLYISACAQQSMQQSTLSHAIMVDTVITHSQYISVYIKLNCLHDLNIL